MLTIYLNTIASFQNKLSEAQLNQLADIANQCPYSGGPGVYRARSILQDYYPNISYNDLGNCRSIGYLKSQKNSEQQRLASIIPNPVNEIANLIFFNDRKVSSSCTIYDAYGKLVKIIAILPGSYQTRFECQDLKPGVYYFQIILDNSENVSGKFIK